MYIWCWRILLALIDCPNGQYRMNGLKGCIKHKQKVAKNNQMAEQTKRGLKVTATGYALHVSDHTSYHTCIHETRICSMHILADLWKQGSVSATRKQRPKTKKKKIKNTKKFKLSRTIHVCLYVWCTRLGLK